MLSIILQITTGTPVELPATATEAPSLSLLDLVVKGGIIMIPIAILSIIAVYIFIERLITIRKASRMPSNFMDTIRTLINSGDVNGIKVLCQQNDSPVARMISKGISRLGRPIKEIESAIENTGKLETANLEKNLGILGIIAAIAPMFGFVGTIIGVIRIFYNISLADNISIGLIAGGLYEKMVTSAAGLIVGIIAHFGYHYLNHLIDNVVYKMELTASEFTDVINETK